MTVDAGNLPKVADKLKDKYPDSLHVVLGDDDRKNAVNKGMAKAEEAATIANGVFTVPAFTAEEKERGLTDFNTNHAGLMPFAIRLKESLLNILIRLKQWLIKNMRQ